MLFQSPGCYTVSDKSHYCHTGDTIDSLLTLIFWHNKIVGQCPIQGCISQTAMAVSSKPWWYVIQYLRPSQLPQLPLPDHFSKISNYCLICTVSWDFLGQNYCSFKMFRKHLVSTQMHSLLKAVNIVGGQLQVVLLVNFLIAVKL